MRVLFAVAGLVAAFSSATARPPTVLEPSSPWDVDYAANNCRLIRVFGTGKDSIKLVFEQVAPRAPMTVMLLGRIDPHGEDDNVLAFESLAGVQIDGGQALDAVGSSDRILFWPRRLGRGRWGLVAKAEAVRMRKADPAASERSPSTPGDLGPSGVSWKDRDWRVQPEEEWQAEEAAFDRRADQVTALVLNPGRAGSIALHSGGLAQPFQALDRCASDSMKDWGIDPAVEATIATGAHPIDDPFKQFGPNDYPMAALRAYKEDNLEVWLNISATGAITSCRVISDFASPEINDAICAMVERKQRFAPARTKEGTPVPDFYTESFAFKLR